ncbi:MAG: aldehyde dehydrogenase family protein, partial [Bryobacteraceae bacterium]
MSTATSLERGAALPAFKNEPYADFTKPETKAAMEAALAKARAELGKDYELLIDGERIKTGDLLKSVNPSRPAEVIGLHHKATAELATRAIEGANAYFPVWSKVPPAERVRLLVRAAALLRERKFEFNAWLVLEAGKTWNEAEPEVGEAIDFCEYYARQMVKLAHPDPVVQMPGEKDEMVYLALGAGIVIPPWNFPLAILAGMTCAALVAGNTVVIKPSSETPTIAAKFAQVLLDAGFPPKSFSLCVGSGSVIGDLLVEHPKTRFISFTGSRDVGLRINELAAKPRKGQIWIKRVVAEMGGKDAIVVDRETDVPKAALGVVQSAFGYQGQKCSACSRAIVDAAIYDEFLKQVQERVATLTIGESDDPKFYMGPVISAGAKKSILEYIETGKKEGRLI